VSGFIDSLLENRETENLTLGMLYAYESPNKSIHLCDGQQRITTLFLLLGMLYKKSKLDTIKNMLVSKSEQDDDWEPYLRYAIRENTLYFLQDLTRYYFIEDEEGTSIDKNNNKISKFIKGQYWYNQDYDNDPSVQSMMLACQIIYDKLEKLDNLDLFISCVRNNIKFFYYDMGDREHGEDLFVIINTTGESLTIPENIKPILLGEIECAINNDSKLPYNNEWEKREEFFWKKRKTDEHIADHGVEDFLTWCIKILDKKDNVELIKYFKLKSGESKNVLQNIEKYFNAFEKLLGLVETKNNFTEIFKQIKEIKESENFVWYFRDYNEDQTHNIILPMLSAIVNYGYDENGLYSLLRRLRKNYFDNKWSETNRQGKYIDWRYVIQLIENSNNFDEFLSFCNSFNNKISNIDLPKSKWYDEDEEFKSTLPIALVIELENHLTIGGRLELFADLLKNSDDKLAEFEKYKKVFEKCFSLDDSDLLRSALLAYGDYSTLWENNRNTLCSDKCWFLLIFSKNDERGVLLNLLREIDTNIDVKDFLKNKCDKCPKNHWVSRGGLKRATQGRVKTGHYFN
jgi:hypothetical protein